jgi:hypothetical protein
MARKTSKWLIGISTGVLVIAVGFIALLWMFFDSGSDPGENARRRDMAVAMKTQIEKHYDKFNKYPSLAEISIEDKNLLMAYIQSGVIVYKAGFAANQFYILRCAFTGPGKTKSGKFSIGWNGIQYSNKKELLLGSPETMTLGSDGFYIWDLH